MTLGYLRLRGNLLEFLMRINEGRFKTVLVRNFFASLLTKTTSPKSTSRVFAGVLLLVIGVLNFYERNKRKGKGYRLRKRKEFSILPHHAGAKVDDYVLIPHNLLKVALVVALMRFMGSFAGLPIDSPARSPCS
jgi:hypothetical protein